MMEMIREANVQAIAMGYESFWQVMGLFAVKMWWVVAVVGVAVVANKKRQSVS